MRQAPENVVCLREEVLSVCSYESTLGLELELTDGVGEKVAACFWRRSKTTRSTIPVESNGCEEHRTNAMTAACRVRRRGRMQGRGGVVS